MSDPNRTPRVSVALPVFEGGKYLAESIESILGQTFEDFELLVCDNASGDGTEEICRAYAARDRRIQYVRRPENLGSAANYNDAFRRARAPYFRWAAHDDLLEPRLLERCVEVLDAAPPSVVMTYPRTVIIDSEGERKREYADDMDLREERPYQRVRHIMKVWSLCNPIFGLMRRDVLARTRLIEPMLCSDVLLLCELALHGQFWEIPEPLFLRRLHEETSRGQSRSFDEMVRWYAPSARGPGLLHPRTHLYLRVLGLAWHSRLPLGERLMCVTATSATWWTRRLRVRAGWVKQRIRGAEG